MKRLLRLSLGVLFLILGVSGLVLPFLQGWLFLALAALVFSIDVPFLSRLVDRLEERFPAIRHLLQRARRFLGKLAED